MEGTWPLRLGGKECGSVTASRRGAYTLFTARADWTGGLTRISLYGGGREGVLGVLAPDGEGVSLRRTLSRSELAAFPAEPEYAAESGASPPPGGPGEEEGEPEGEGAPEAAERTESEAAPPGGAQLWFEGSDGALAGFDGRRRLVALPSEGVAVPDWAEGVVRRINGREYVVFPR